MYIHIYIYIYIHQNWSKRADISTTEPKNEGGTKNGNEKDRFFRIAPKAKSNWFQLTNTGTEAADKKDHQRRTKSAKAST